MSSSQTSATEEQKGVTHGDQGKENQHTGERPREYTGKKRVRRLFFWWDKLRRKLPNTYTSLRMKEKHS